MKRLVQKLVDLNPAITSNASKLQELLDSESSNGWEFSGQIGLFYVFKRWENVPDVVEGGNPNSPYNPYSSGINRYGYGSGGGSYPYQSPSYYPHPTYNPSSWGNRVNSNEDDQ